MARVNVTVERKILTDDRNTENEKRVGNTKWLIIIRLNPQIWPNKVRLEPTGEFIPQDRFSS